MLVRTETVTPTALAPVEELGGAALAVRMTQVGKRSVHCLAEDCRFIAKFCDDLDREEVWKRTSADWDEVCRKSLGYPGEIIQLSRAAAAVLNKLDKP